MAWFISALLHGVLFLVLIGTLGGPKPAALPPTQVFLLSQVNSPEPESELVNPRSNLTAVQRMGSPSAKNNAPWPFEKSAPGQVQQLAVVCQKDPWLLRVTYGDSPAQVAQAFGSPPVATRMWSVASGESLYAVSYLSPEGRLYSALFNTHGLIKSLAGGLEEALYAYVDGKFSNAVQRGELTLSVAEWQRLLALKEIYGPQLPSSWLASMQARIQKARLYEAGAISADEFYAAHSYVPTKTNC